MGGVGVAGRSTSPRKEGRRRRLHFLFLSLVPAVPGLSPVCPRYSYVITIGRFLFDNNGLRIQLLELSPRPRRLPVTRTLFCFGGSTSGRPRARAAHGGPAAAPSAAARAVGRRIDQAGGSALARPAPPAGRRAGFELVAKQRQASGQGSALRACSGMRRSGSDAAMRQLHPLCVLVLPVQLQRESVSLSHHHPAHRAALGLAGPACNACPPAAQRWAGGAHRWLMARWTTPGTRPGAACWDRCAYGTAWRCGRGTTSPPLRKRSR